MTNIEGWTWLANRISFRLTITANSEGGPLAEFEFWQGDTRLTWDAVDSRWSEIPSVLCEVLHELLSSDIPSSDGASA